MTKSAPKSSPAKTTWVWRKTIPSPEQETWATRLDEGFAGLTWGVQFLSSRRVEVEVFSATDEPLLALQAKWGGKLSPISDDSWLKPRKAKPLILGNKLIIGHDSKPRSKLHKATVPQLEIPYGMAFGSGEHETTEMLLRSLVDLKQVPDVLDLGTGSGILALAARKLGAKQVMGIDFEADSIRTCIENEKINFQDQTITWVEADLKSWEPTRQWPLIIANLYSDLLIEIAPRLKNWLESKGDLWVSGILKTQARSVETAFKRQGFITMGRTEYGKWVMLMLLKR